MSRLVRFAFMLSIATGVLLSTMGAARADDPPAVGKNAKLQISGVGWLSYRYALKDELARSNGTTVGMSSTLDPQDMNEFDVDRVYLTADYMFDDRFSWQTTIEARNFAGEPDIFLKRAFVQVKKPFGMENMWVRMGQIAHVMTPVAEKAWGFRSVAQTGIDRYLGVSTTWLGVGLGGTPTDAVDWEFEIANDKPYNRAVESKYKTFQGRVTVTPMASDETMKAFKIAIWAQGNSNLPTDTRLAPSMSDNMNVWCGILPHFVGPHYGAGIGIDLMNDKFAFINDQDKEDTDTRKQQLITGLGWYDLTEKVRGFARVEMYDPNTDVDSDGRLNVNAGIARTYIKGIRSIVDVEYTKYQERDDANPETPGNQPDDFDPDITLSARIEVTL